MIGNYLPFLKGKYKKMKGKTHCLHTIGKNRADSVDISHSLHRIINK